MNSDQYVEEIEHTRREIDRTLLSLEDRLSPRELLEQAIRWSGGAKEFSANLGRTIRDNPIPATLLAISLVWLMVAGTSRAAHYTVSPSQEQVNRQMQDIDPRLNI